MLLNKIDILKKVWWNSLIKFYMKILLMKYCSICSCTPNHRFFNDIVRTTSGERSLHQFPEPLLHWHWSWDERDLQQPSHLESLWEVLPGGHGQGGHCNTWQAQCRQVGFTFFFFFFFFFEGLYFFFKKTLFEKTSILKSRTIKSLKEEEIPSWTKYY